jgi:hypothetical protein
VEKRLSLADYGKHLWTRELARSVRTRVAEILDTLERGETLVIDATGVEVFDYSFANELFGKTALTLPREYPGRFVIVEHLSTYARENLANALESLGLVMIERRDGESHLLGKVNPIDESTFAAVAHARGPVAASTLKERLGIKLTAVNERLNKLVALALLRREKATSAAGREQFLYYAPT